MTVVCVKDGFIACDSQVTSAGLKIATTPKLVLITHGRYAGGYTAATGAGVHCLAFTDWIKNGMIGESPFNESNYMEDGERSKINGIVVGKWFNPDEYLYSHNGYTLEDYHGPFIAMGVAREFALGAMSAGASAEEAVRLSCDYVSGCGGPISVAKYLK